MLEGVAADVMPFLTELDQIALIEELRPALGLPA